METKKSVYLIFSSIICVFSVAHDLKAASGGIGAQITVENGWLTVVRALDGTPASRNGLLPGDRIIKIDGETTQNKSLQDSLRLLAGKAGEGVTLTISRQSGGETRQFSVTMIREAILPGMASGTRDSQNKSSDYVCVPTKEAGPVQWKGNKIVSRVLPYPDFISLFIRLPIAHALVTGQGVNVAVIQLSGEDKVSSMVQQISPGAEVRKYSFESTEGKAPDLVEVIGKTGCRVAVVPDADSWDEQLIFRLARQLRADKIIMIIPSDFSEDKEKIKTVNTLHSLGALTVGRVDHQSLVMETVGGGRRAFNRHIRRIRTDVFSTIGLEPFNIPTNAVATAAGVAALVFEKWPELTGAQVCDKIIAGAREVWQGTSVESGKWDQGLLIDPITTKYTPRDEGDIFRFRVLDSAGALKVDTEIPWFLNMLNCQKAWEIAKGKGTVVVVSDQGFHIKHPDLVNSIKTAKNFGPLTFETANQNFHGTDMSRILLAVAPEARIIPVLCSGPTLEGMVPNITRSFEFAAEQKADVITSSWSGQFNKNEKLIGAIGKAVDSGTVVSWFHYPQAYPGLLRSRFTYCWWEIERYIGFADRFLTDPPGFHPVEIEAGLSGTAPQAAGIAALARSANPGLTPSEIEDLIFQNSTPISRKILIPDAYRIVLAAKEHNSGKEVKNCCQGDISVWLSGGLRGPLS